MRESNHPKILYIVSQLGQGGAEQQLYYLLKYLKPHATVLSLAPGGYWLKPFQELGYRVIEVPRSGSYDPSRLVKVMQTVRAEKPDIVHLWMDGIPGAYGRLGTLLLRYRPTIVGIRNHPARDPGWYGRVRRLLLNRHISLFNGNAVSSLDYLVEREGIPQTRTRYIPNGIELHRFAPRQDDEAKKLLPEGWREKVIVGTVGALAARKSPEVFVRLVRRVVDENPDIRFIHAGDGPLRDSTHQLSRELKLDDHLLFLGSRSDVPDVLRAMDIFIMTSSNEGTPNAAMEAMATALPCVVTDTGDCKELVLEGQTGFVAPVGDVDCLAGHILRLAGDAALRQRLGQAGYARVQAYDVHPMAEQYQAMYREVLSK